MKRSGRRPETRAAKRARRGFTEAGLDLLSLTPDQWSQAQKTRQARGAGAELTR